MCFSVAVPNPNQTKSHSYRNRKLPIVFFVFGKLYFTFTLVKVAATSFCQLTAVLALLDFKMTGKYSRRFRFIYLKYFNVDQTETVAKSTILLIAFDNPRRCCFICLRTSARTL